jgi:uncharacterized protein (DUF4415 family)
MQMSANKTSMATGWSDPDDAPDLSAPEWQRRFDGVKVSRGRPKLDDPKVSNTIRLDADIIEKFRAKGPGWQTRINDALRDWLKKAG